VHFGEGAEVLAAVIAVVAAVSGGLGTLFSQWLARRKASGRVGTSEAAVLWEQAQDMRQMLLEEKSKAEEQRDRLIESYTGQIIPLLTSINTGLRDLYAAASKSQEVPPGAGMTPLQGGGYALVQPDAAPPPS
jgi:hypothetical protein